MNHNDRLLRGFTETYEGTVQTTDLCEPAFGMVKSAFARACGGDGRYGPHCRGRSKPRARMFCRDLRRCGVARRGNRHSHRASVADPPGTLRLAKGGGVIPKSS